MNARRILAIILMFFAALLIISVPVWFFTPLKTSLFAPTPPNLNGPPLKPLTYRPIPLPTPQAVLTAQGAPAQINASEAILLDAATGTILVDKDAESPVPMASTTKIMTALIALRSGRLATQVTIAQDAANEVTQNDGSSALLVPGDTIRLQDLLYGLMLPSGDDAAVAIADALAGSTQNFVAIMNIEAAKLHLYQTHFANVDGLPPTDSQGNAINGTHYSTAYDLVRLARYAMSIPLFAQIVQTRTYTLTATANHHTYKWTTTNKLLGVYQGMLGIKTGSTPEAGDCLVFAATRKGQTLIGVILHSATDASRFQDAQTLLDWGFALPLKIPQI